MKASPWLNTIHWWILWDNRRGVAASFYTVSILAAWEDLLHILPTMDVMMYRYSSIV